MNIRYQVILAIIVMCSLSFAGCGDHKEIAKSVDEQSELIDEIKSLKSSDLCADMEMIAEKVQSLPLSEFQKLKFDLQFNVCSIEPRDIDALTIADGIDDNGLSAYILGDFLYIFSRATSDTAPQLCCSIQKANWRRRLDGIWVAQFRLKDASKARLMFMDSTGVANLSQPVIIQGKKVVETTIPFLADPSIDIAGHFYKGVERSESLGEDRQYSLYLPPMSKGQDIGVVLFADGQSLEYYSRMIDPMIEQGLINPIIMIGIHSGRSAIANPVGLLPEDPRATDYLPKINAEFPKRFSSHMSFVFEQLLPKILQENQQNITIGKTAVVGHSNGAVFATHAGLENPEQVDLVLAVSQGYGGIKNIPEIRSESAKFYISAGLYEPSFLASSKLTRNRLEDNGYNVVASFEAVGHDPEFFKHQLYHFLMAEFGQ